MRLLLAWLLLSLPIYADQFDEIRDFIRTHLTADQVPSISVAVARDGRIVWEEGFGWADREKSVAANEHTMYSLASITKPFTATGLMTLVEQKRIDLDRPINQYLGNAKLRARVGNADDATVRRVANHTSGLPFHYQFFYEDEPYRPPSMDETILRYGNLVTIPGKNTNTPTWGTASWVTSSRESPARLTRITCGGPCSSSSGSPTLRWA